MLATRITKSDYYKTHAESVERNESSKRVTYLSLNPNLIVPSVYRNRFIPEYKRIRYTRLRVSSHNLKIETGRWCRIPKAQRMCDCLKDIQTEEHVVLFCEKTREVRCKYNISSTDIGQLFMLDDETVIDFLYEVMAIMEL